MLLKVSRSHSTAADEFTEIREEFPADFPVFELRCSANKISRPEKIDGKGEIPPAVFLRFHQVQQGVGGEKSENQRRQPGIEFHIIASRSVVVHSMRRRMKK